MKRFSFLLLSVIVLATALSAQVYLDPSAPLEERIDNALSRMTLQEKISMIHAQSKFSSPGVARLGIPGIWCTDGPHGIRPEVLWDEWNNANWTNDSCTAFPALTALAATWNPDLALLYGEMLGEEALYRNKNVVLGPGVNIYRTPLNGRNFEYMGEDPLLASRMVVPYIKGLQSKGVAACVKHFALNNQEYNRHGYNVNLSDRALYEIYLPAFKAAVTEGKAWSLMGAYNLYKGQHACENQYLLKDILRNEWQSDLCVISDWGGAHNTELAVPNGLDLEYGTWTNGLTVNNKEYDSYMLAEPFRLGILEGKYTEEQLNEKVRNVLRLIFRTSMNPNRGFGSMVSEEHLKAAREIAAESIVLLKNEGGLLPIQSNVNNILVVGENAVKMMTVGGGSSQLKVKHEVSPLEALKQHATVTYQRGYSSGENNIQDNVDFHEQLSDPRTAEQMISDAVEAARKADLVIFIGGLNKKAHQDCEDSDREQYNLPYGQDRLIEALLDANPRLVVVNMSGNAVAMPWAEKVPAVIQTWYLGSEGGNALADVLFGNVNPSGRLPFTICRQLTDYPAHQAGKETYPGVSNGQYDELYYTEDIFVGYRFTDLAGQKQKVINQKLKTKNQKPRTPLYSFGFGLSYTTFLFGQAQISDKEMTKSGSLQVQIPVTNTGSRAGKQVVQLYISDLKSTLPRPLKELKAFQKVELQPGETKIVTFTITDEMLRYFNPDKHQWESESGDFEALIASSAADIHSRLRFSLK
ncbi:MAG: glycoside hydrolase family 3 C-terminal domain-containing protein [Paludibacteraceae bacterium]|nr:glycoside hydrolase family 3 C-terminal domain-containing protein [Paludibacteraceae bacterium]